MTGQSNNTNNGEKTEEKNKNDGLISQLTRNSHGSLSIWVSREKFVKLEFLWVTIELILIYLLEFAGK